MDDVVQAVTNAFTGSTDYCPADDCTEVEGTWVYDNVLEEYVEEAEVQYW